MSETIAGSGFCQRNEVFDTNQPISLLETKNQGLMQRSTTDTGLFDQPDRRFPGFFFGRLPWASPGWVGGLLMSWAREHERGHLANWDNVLSSQFTKIVDNSVTSVKRGKCEFCWCNESNLPMACFPFWESQCNPRVLQHSATAALWEKQEGERWPEWARFFLKKKTSVRFWDFFQICFILFSCPNRVCGQLDMWPCHWLTYSLSEPLFDFGTYLSEPTDLWPLRYLIRVMRKHDLTNILIFFFNFDFFWQF